MVLLVGWTLFVFAHSYRLSAVPLAGGIVLLALFRPPTIARRDTRALDVALVIVLGAIALQLVPLTRTLRSVLAPAAVAYDRTMRIGGESAGSRTLSIDPASTLLALAIVAAMAVLFWLLRGMLERGGVRGTIRAVAWFGLLVSPIAIVHHVMPLPLLDGIWGTTPRGLRPYGPFVNRNDFAGWLIMAIPLTLGYALARTESRRRPAETSDGADYPDFAGGGAFPDNTSLWLSLTLGVMMAGLLFSMSRSALLGALTGLMFFAWFGRARLAGSSVRWSIGAAVVVFGVAALFADVDALSVRLEDSLSEGLGGRVSIWRQTLPVVGDFWSVGSGVGTYQSVMVPYQTMSRLYYISHADNELLQIVAEGGVLVGLPVALAIIAGAILMAKQLRVARAGVFWLRLGAAAGIVAFFIQNMVEMTLRIPANAVLFVVLAAVALHSQHQRP